MFQFKRKAITTVDNGLTPCQSGDVLFTVDLLKKYIPEIKKLLSCPEGMFESLYLSTLYRLAEFCQAMPFSEKESFNAYGLIERQLQLAVAALKLRRGLLLPKNAGAETIAVDEAQWTYAIFSAALLRNIHHVQRDRVVSLHYKNGEIAGLCNLLSGSLYENTFYYSVKFATQSHVENTDIMMAALSGRIIPPVAFRWLAANTELNSFWWNSILHKPLPLCELTKLIDTAAQKLGFSLSYDDETLEKRKNSKDGIEHFMGWIIQIIKYNPDHIFRLKEGLFINEVIIADYLSENASLPKQTILSQLARENCFVNDNEPFYQTLSPKQFEDRRVFRGIILKSEILPDGLKTLPLNTHFQENISL